MTFAEVTQIAVSVAFLALLAFQSINLILRPEEFLVKFNRPLGEKHVRATRFIGSLGLAVFFLALFQWVRALSKS